jgi:hypothetical protein
MFNILGHKGNANQKNIEISPHTSQNDYNQEYKWWQMLARMQVEKESLYTIAGNVT